MLVHRPTQLEARLALGKECAEQNVCTATPLHSSSVWTFLASLLLLLLLLLLALSEQRRFRAEHYVDYLLWSSCF